MANILRYLGINYGETLQKTQESSCVRKQMLQDLQDQEDDADCTKEGVRVTRDILSDECWAKMAETAKNGFSQQYVSTTRTRTKRQSDKITEIIQPHCRKLGLKCVHNFSSDTVCVSWAKEES